ncbi:gliding motility-associated C-terminal domain-containing protein [Belliella marina]|uniref:Gliding motility-associated C-terminal domain-containing protein n=1 Tax=Belliella marina TaxID=1644146 RepID=A0ABW4VRU0_9BACT
MRVVKFILLYSLFFLGIESLEAQVRVPFQPRSPDADPTKKNYRINGDFLIIGNTNLTLEDYDDNKMNDNRMVYTSAFAGGTGLHLNSSAAELRFPQINGVNHDCTEILYAGLYWTGRSGPDRMVQITDVGAFRTKDKQQITFQGPRPGQIANLITDPTSIRFPVGMDTQNDVGIFVGYLDVTDFVKFNREGSYVGIDVALLQGTNYYFGGWSLVVVYENPQLPLKDITVFDGYAFVRGNFPEEFVIPIDDIKTQEKGDVRVKVGIMAGEGDVAAEGDFFSIERGVGTNDFVPLSHASNSTTNFFNSSIEVGNSLRNPLFKNNTGMDLATFYIDNPNNELIGNNQTSLRFKYGTTFDTYVIYNLTIAIDIDEPKIEGFHQFLEVNGNSSIPNSFKPGDELTLAIDIRNLGEERLLSNRLELTLPKGVELMSVKQENIQQSTTTGVSQTINPDGSTIISWEMGNLDPAVDIQEILANFTYTIRISENCDDLAGLCGASFSLNGFLTGIQSSSGESYGQIPLVIQKEAGNICTSGTSIPGSIDLSLEVFDFYVENCLNLEDGNIEICNLSLMTQVSMPDISKFFPANTRFFDRNPLEPNALELGGNSGNPFPASSGIDFYASFSEDELGCYVPFQLAEKVLSINVDVDKACDSSDGLRAITMDIIGLSPSSKLLLNELPVTINDLQRLAPGDYTLEIEDGICTVSESFEVATFEVFDVVMIASKSVFEIPCMGSDVGLLVLEVNGNTEFNKLELKGILENGSIIERSVSNPLVGEHIFDLLPAGRYEWLLESKGSCTQEGQTLIVETNVTQVPAELSFSSIERGNAFSFLVGEDIQFFIDQPSIYNDVNWDFGDGQSSTLESPVHAFRSTGTFTIVLSLLDENGCLLLDQKEIQISGGNLRVPDAFSPNGDGVNDYFFPVFLQVEELTLSIFNRWGELLFYTNDPASKGWDGSNRGQLSPVGSYAYQLEYRMEGESSQILRGTFFLIK